MGPTMNINEWITPALALGLATLVLGLVTFLNYNFGKRFDDLGDRFSDLSKRLDKLDERVWNIDRLLGVIAGRMKSP